MNTTRVAGHWRWISWISSTPFTSDGWASGGQDLDRLAGGGRFEDAEALLGEETEYCLANEGHIIDDEHALTRVRSNGFGLMGHCDSLCRRGGIGANAGWRLRN